MLEPGFSPLLRKLIKNTISCKTKLELGILAMDHHYLHNNCRNYIRMAKSSRTY